MCVICGCGADPQAATTPTPDHHHDHGHDHDHGHAHGDDGALRITRPTGATPQLIHIEQDLLGENARVAQENRRDFARRGVFALNFISSPGAGKTALLVRTLERLLPTHRAAVVEGDQETSQDAARIRATGAPAVQINTGRLCHLDAAMVRTAVAHLPSATGHEDGGFLFVENVGNLVCPTGFDLGEAHKIALVSVTEGEDKPLKYPDLFAKASLLLVTKADLQPHVDCDVDLLVANARRIRPDIAVMTLSAKTGEGLDRWLQWLHAGAALFRASA